MKRFLWLIILPALLLAACASDNEITIRTAGMRFVADEVRVKAGQPVTLHVVNRDGFAHAFDIDEFDISTRSSHPRSRAATASTAAPPATKPPAWRACWLSSHSAQQRARSGDWPEHAGTVR